MTKEFREKCRIFLGYQYKHHKYNEDWNWLHKIIDKIEATHDEFHGYFWVYMSSNRCTIHGSKFDTERQHVYFDEQYGEDKKEATVLAINNFIDFYNKNKVNKG